MTIEQLTDLYSRGLCSPINYYIDLFSLLKAGADLDSVMGKVPEPLLGRIQEIAGRHTSSPTENPDRSEAQLAQMILEWKKDKKIVVPPAPGRQRTRRTEGRSGKEG